MRKIRLLLTFIFFSLLLLPTLLYLGDDYGLWEINDLANPLGNMFQQLTYLLFNFLTHVYLYIERIIYPAQEILQYRYPLILWLLRLVVTFLVSFLLATLFISLTNLISKFLRKMHSTKD